MAEHSQVAEAPQDQPRRDEETLPKPGFKEWALKTAGTIVGSLGLAGAMVVIGSAVLWARFKEAGIPANQAVAVQTREEALVQGAQTTIFFVVAALAIVAILYATDSHEAEKPDEAPSEPHEIGKWTMGVILVLPAIALLWAALATDLSRGAVVVLGLIAAALAVGCLVLGLNDRKNFWALAGAVFVAVVAFSAVAEYLIVKEQKFVQAMAVVRGPEDTGLTGFYVAATDKNLYIAQPAGRGAPVYEVSRGEGVTYAVGPLEDQEGAKVRAKAILKQLIENQKGNSSEPSNQKTASKSSSIGRVARAFRGAIRILRLAARKKALCVARYSNAAKPSLRGRWWTSCAEAKRLRTIRAARARLALPRRFQAAYDMRVFGRLPAGSRSLVLAGRVAPQCEQEAPPPCGHRYPGGGFQYYVSRPRVVRITATACTIYPESRPSRWKACNQNRKVGTKRGNPS